MFGHLHCSCRLLIYQSDGACVLITRAREHKRIVAEILDAPGKDMCLH